MKIVRKSRKIKSRYIGSVSDMISTDHNFVYGISPAINCLKDIKKIVIRSSGKKLPYYLDAPKVYSDEIPLPSYQFLTQRSSYFLEKERTEVAGLWHKLSLNCLKFV